jgi:hypothetical protein
MNIELLRQRATKFAKTFETARSEISDGQNFIRDFCDIFGLNYRRAVSFEKKIKKLNNKRGRIDGFFPSLLLVEMKSAGENLEEAYQQATSYFPGLKDEELPLCVLVSDFQYLHLYNQETHEEPLKIKLAELPQYIEYFRFLEGFETKAIEKQDRTNRQAAEKMADLHDAIKKTGYTGKDLETYLVRLLFCLFADNTDLFGENNQFLNYLINYTKKDGSDLHGALSKLFDTLNLPDESYLIKYPNYKGKKRLNNLPEHLNKFSYINGLLFEGILAECYFDEMSRNTLIECAKLDWSEISPAIFGALFQSIMHFDDEQSTAKTKKRREFGAHYTSEENILKTINPLFMDDLRIEFAKYKNNKRQLIDFHHKLSTLNFFDPACGCGNFLIIAYRELRLLELEIIKTLRKENLEIDVSTLIKCDVDQFYGVDIDESAIHIATVAMWLTDHQMNLKVQQLGQYFKRTPLKKKANIFQANALRIDWKDIISPDKCSFIMGNPPFVGRQYQNKEQKEDLELVFEGMKGAGVLDYVTAWHIKAAKYIQENQNISVAFVSTNSLTQGEQVAILWSELLKLKIRLHFAHRTFKWTNEGRGIAAVHCVILGFGLQELKQYRLFDYGNDISGEPIEIKATQINPYLVDAPTVLIEKRRKPLNESTLEMVFGNMPNDGGHLILSLEEVDFIQQNDPIAASYIRRFLGAEEFINNLPRFCLWLKESTTHDRLASPEIKKRMELVKKTRLESPRETTNKLAELPYLFGEIRQTNDHYLALPEVSSENRKYIPIGFLTNEIASNKLYMLPNADFYYFGLLTSTMHMAWTRAVCGRLESRYQYSTGIVYNNFPFPENVKPAIKNKIEEAAQMILDARAIEEQRCINNKQKYSLAMLYAANNMPEELQKAHKALDKAVDAAYNYKGSKEDAARVAYLFELYQKVTSPLIKEKPSLKKTKKTKPKA